MPEPDDSENKSGVPRAERKKAERQKREIRREVLIAVVVLLGLFGIQHLLEHTRLVEAIRIWTFSYLQRAFSDTTEDRPPIVLLDIKDVARAVPTNAAKGAVPVTNRAQLREIVDALHTAGATAVGVDVDMSPNESGFMDRDADPDLFEHWKTLSNEMPVFLGVYRTRNLPANRWLGLSEFAALGAFLGTAETPDGERVTRMVSHYRPGSPVEQKEAEGEKLPTLGYALAQAYLRTQNLAAPKVGSLKAHFVEPLSENEEGRLVNFSKAGQFTRERTTNVDSKAISGGDARNYKGKVVILGDVYPEQLLADSFLAPGLKRLPGVLYHACATWTFAFEPVYEFNFWTRTVLDLGLGSIFVLAVWARARFKRNAQAGQGSFVRLLEQYALVTASVLLLLIALVSMYFFDIMWLDSVVVAFGLLLHYLFPQQLKELFPSKFGEGGSDDGKTTDTAH